MKIKIGEGVCKKCVWGGEYSEGCSYMAIQKKSRLVENGERYDPQYCTKFEEGTKEHGAYWKAKRKEQWNSGKIV